MVSVIDRAAQARRARWIVLSAATAAMGFTLMARAVTVTDMGFLPVRASQFEDHVHMDAPAPDLDKLGPQELLDVLAITSEQWGLIADKLEVIAQTAKSPTMVHVRAELTRATALRSRVRDRLVDLLNRLPR